MQVRGVTPNARSFFQEFSEIAVEEAKAFGLVGKGGKSPLPPRCFGSYLSDLQKDFIPLDAISSANQLQAQKNLLQEALELVKPFLEQIRNLVILLEKYTCNRKEKERIELLKASGLYEPPDPPPEVNEEETDEFYTTLFDQAIFQKLLTEFPIQAHRILLEKMVLLDMFFNSSADNNGLFHELMDAMVLRIKYKHFFDPPLVAIDILVCETPNPDIPGGYIALTNDLNYLSSKNKRVAEQDAALAAQADDADDNPKKKVERLMALRVREKGRHVFLIGKRFDPLTSWPGVPKVKLEAHMSNKTNFAAYLPQSGPETIDEPGIL
ncbi:unnamed protein product, partial [Amoebophrya sp. A120]|eukprot:GSA120T00007381001.1